MATIVLSAVGSAIGAGFGGTVLGLSGAVIGRAIGATIGRVIDQQLLGAGSEAVETGRVERFRLTGASEGAPVGQIWGRTRVGGQVIWATRFTETATTHGGGKGAPQPTVTEYSYGVSLAVAVCEGTIAGIGRVWADGVEMARDSLPMRVYSGSETQQPDPKIEAVEGAGMAPAYRGIAYVVFENLQLAQFGNRVPQFTFEVIRRAAASDGPVPKLIDAVRAVALIPGTGEYALATTPVYYEMGPGVYRSANVHTPGWRTDMTLSLSQLRREAPRCGAVSLVVSWFGDDLRAGHCHLRPKVEGHAEGYGMAWRAGGITRAEAQVVPSKDGALIYGGTPADGSVIEAIRALGAAGKSVMFYPFILMEQLAGNGLPDPYGGTEQPALPWRGRITGNVAPGLVGTTDGTAAATSEIAAFFGAAQPGHFANVDGQVTYSGPSDDWGYRRFILGYASLVKMVGGVESFCIGSEMRGLSRLRDASGGFPFAEAMRVLAADVRSLLGAGVKITYAADWSEYGSYTTPQGDLTFPLDALWADENIDFIGIDNYLPISDWRDGEENADAAWGSIYNLDYLMANIGGGEYFDWYYETEAAAALQIRTPITDGAYDEPWAYRVKDIRSWWENSHFPRPGGVRSTQATAWGPGSKPIRFTEIGCPAIDKGTNQPNVFVDPKSSESRVPRASRGTRDDLIQQQYLRAMAGYWADPANNPEAELYAGRMVDHSRAHVWAWDARPFPAFPNQTTVWSDGGNYTLGHWLTGRMTAEPLGAVVREICAGSGVAEIDTARLHGLVRGYTLDRVDSGRSALQPLMLALGFDAVEREGALQFRLRDWSDGTALDEDRFALVDGADSALELSRAAAAEVVGRVRLTYVAAGGDFQVRTAEAVFPGEAQLPVSSNEVPLVLTGAEGGQITERWLAAARVARDGVKFALPPSAGPLGAGDVVRLRGALWRIDRAEEAGASVIEAVRVEPGNFQASDAVEERIVPRAFTPPVPVYPLFLDLPLLTGDEVPWAPHLAVTATPWPGTVACYSAIQDAGYTLNTLLPGPTVIGVTETNLWRVSPGLWDAGPALRVKVYGGDLASAGALEVLNGANVAAIGDGSSETWELFQFQEATLVAPDTYDLSLRLRGQAGTDAVTPLVWPVGSTFVLLNGTAKQIALPSSARGVERNYRIGAASCPYDDPNYVHEVAAFSGIGLRPYSPCHLTASRDAGGDLAFSWIRRTRIDGDSWEGIEVPLGEAREAYVVRVSAGGVVRREETVSVPGWTYAAAAQAADGVAAPFTLSVAQLSDSFGPGPFAALTVEA